MATLVLAWVIVESPFAHQSDHRSPRGSVYSTLLARSRWTVSESALSGAAAGHSAHHRASGLAIAGVMARRLRVNSATRQVCRSRGERVSSRAR
jgi:hypothetical protein